MIQICGKRINDSLAFATQSSSSKSTITRWALLPSISSTNGNNLLSITWLIIVLSWLIKINDAMLQSIAIGLLHNYKYQEPHKFVVNDRIINFDIFKCTRYVFPNLQACLLMFSNLFMYIYNFSATRPR